MAVTIYGLLDPDSGLLCYVGKAVDEDRRFAGHLRDSARRNTPVSLWIRELLTTGKRPVLKVLRTCAAENWQAVERAEIAAARSIGLAHLNLADGGNQPHCPPEVRARNGRLNAKARVSTPKKARFYELKRTLSQALKRGELSEATKSKLLLGAAKHPELLGSFARLLG